MNRVAVVDYGMGNLRSVAKALTCVAPRAEVTVVTRPEDLLAADRVVFPGQGAMPDCLQELNRSGLRDAVLEAARSRPFLGICLGLQMLFERSDEGPSQGFGLLPGDVRRFVSGQTDAQGRPLKIPHMGWNGVENLSNHSIWRNITPGTRFYFVHSYFASPADAGHHASQTQYGHPFVSAVQSENVFAVQFHPEKSAGAGLQLLSNFIDWKP